LRKVWKCLQAFLASLLILALVGAGGALYLLHRYGSDLPDYRQLADYQPPTVTRIHAADGRLMAEYAQEKRIFVPVEAIPKRVIQAFLAAEDKNFYSHPGIDPLGILRAALTDLWRLGDNRRPVGASTITQQVAKNFLLSNEVSLSRSGLSGRSPRIRSWNCTSTRSISASAPMAWRRRRSTISISHSMS